MRRDYKELSEVMKTTTAKSFKDFILRLVECCNCHHCNSLKIYKNGSTS
ncbi:hypothetical protein KY318_01725 [Candidatus Woesearchaeota archaeon]|nr:hypothetical protein [Candidatus Woesearchaeota archaeon]